MTHPKPDGAQPGTGKWKGVERLAQDIEAYLGLQHCSKPIDHMIARKIRERLEPLLNLLARVEGNPPYDDLSSEIEEELATWR